jgi:hypothetical protein
MRGQPLCQRLPPSLGLPTRQRLDELLCGHHQDRFGQRDDDLAVDDLDPDHAFDLLDSAIRPLPLPVSVYDCTGPHGFTPILAFRNCSGV